MLKSEQSALVNGTKDWLAELHELRQKFQEHSHAALGAEPNLTIDEGTSGPNIAAQDLFQDDYQI